MHLKLEESDLEVLQHRGSGYRWRVSKNRVKPFTSSSFLCSLFISFWTYRPVSVSASCCFFPPAKELPNWSVYCSKSNCVSPKTKKKKEEFVSRGGGCSELLSWLRLKLVLFLASEQPQSYQSSHSLLHHCGPSSHPRHHISMTSGRSVQFHSGTGQPCTWTWLQDTQNAL